MITIDIHVALPNRSLGLSAHEEECLTDDLLMIFGQDAEVELEWGFDE